MRFDAATARRELAEAAEQIARGDDFSGLARLGIVRASLHALPPRQRSDVERDLDRIAHTADEGAVRHRVREDLERLASICAHLQGIISEEVLLVLTIRIQLAAALLVSRGAAIEFTHDLQRSDDGIVEIAKHAPSAYRIALRLIERNWRSALPFDPELLGIRRLIDWGTGA